MIKQITLSELSDDLAETKTKKKEFLNRIDRIVPWDEWLKIIEPHYYKGERGNKPYDKELMLCGYICYKICTIYQIYANSRASNRQPSIFRFL